MEFYELMLKREALNEKRLAELKEQAKKKAMAKTPRRRRRI